MDKRAGFYETLQAAFKFGVCLRLGFLVFCFGFFVFCLVGFLWLVGGLFFGVFFVCVEVCLMKHHPVDRN